MEQSFSQRMSLKPVRNTVQVDSMDEELRKALWNNFYQSFWSMKNWGTFRDLIYDLWANFFMKLIDEAPDYKSLLQTTIKELYFSLKWYEVYDFIEFVANRFQGGLLYTDEFVKACNVALTKHLSAYRFMGRTLVPITSDQEIIEVQRALDVTKSHTYHLEKALKLLADRTSPDYVNSIKDSILAVEAICKLLTGNPKATLGQALDRLGTILPDFHPSLKEAFQKLYGYASDAEGIRHGLVGKPNLDFEDARFMFIACSAFINYLFAKADKAKMDLSQN